MKKENLCHSSLVMTLLGFLSILIMEIIFTSIWGCTTIKVPDTEVCSVAGVMGAGADCAHTLTRPPQTRSMNLDEWIEFLEPQEAKKDSLGVEIVPARGGALCQSSEDWNKQKTVLEQACKLLGPSCSYQIKSAIDNLDRNINALQEAGIEKKGRVKHVGDL